jgi:peroxiredoxin
LVDAYPEFRNAYTRLVLISTDNQLSINEFRDALGATWPFLSDPDRTIQKDLDIKEFTDEPHDPMIPHTFVLEPGLRIFKVYNGYWYWGAPRWQSCMWIFGLSFKRFGRTSIWRRRA